MFMYHFSSSKTVKGGCCVYSGLTISNLCGLLMPSGSGLDSELIGPGDLHVTKVDFSATALSPKDVGERLPR